MRASREFRRNPWNKGKVVGQKAPLKLREIWAIRVRLQLRSSLRDLALFNLAVDCKLRAWAQSAHACLRPVRFIRRSS